MERRSGFTLVEIMIVVALIAVLTSIAIPTIHKARDKSQRTACMYNMRQIEGAKEQWAIENGKSNGTSATWEDILPYLMKLLVCPAEGEYKDWEIGTPIYCTVHDWRNNPEYNGFTP